MRGFDRIDEWKLLQVGPRTTILVDIATIWSIFYNLW